MWNVEELRFERAALRINHPYASETDIVLKSDMLFVSIAVI